jgi:hypothetical protein
LQIEAQLAPFKLAKSSSPFRSTADLGLQKIGLGRVFVKIHGLADAAKVFVPHMLVEQIPDVGLAEIGVADVPCGNPCLSATPCSQRVSPAGSLGS